MKKPKKIASSQDSFPITCKWTDPSSSNTSYYECTCNTSTCDISNIIDTTSDWNSYKDNALTQIALSGYKNITKIIISDLSKLSGLISLNLSYNNITDLPNLSDLKNLQHVYLQNNNTLYSFPNVQNLTALTVLNLSTNSIDSIPKDAFVGTPSVSVLLLDNNKIKVLEDDVFSNFAASVGNSTLTLDKNGITDANLMAFPTKIASTSNLSLCGNPGFTQTQCNTLGFTTPGICTTGECSPW